MIKAYKYRLLPSEDQKVILNNWIGTCRFIYNLGLETKIAAWVSARKTLNYFDLGKQLTDLRKEVDWIKDCPQQVLEYSLSNLETAYKGFFKGKGFPNFKNKYGKQSISFRRNTVVESGRVKLTKIGWISFVEHRKLPKGEIRTVTVSRTPTGNFFVSILIKDDNEIPDKKPLTSDTTVGVDVGLKSFATLSDGMSIEPPKPLFAQLKRLRVEQRKLQRKFKRGAKEQSKAYYKQKMVVAKIHEKIANQRADFLHKLSHFLVSKYDTICIEDLNISGLLKNGRMAKSISDASWYAFFTFLAYKAEWNGKNIIKIGRFDPSSKICSSCGNIFKELKLSDREWTCEKCGTHHDRDINAAKNIKIFGLGNKNI